MIRFIEFKSKLGIFPVLSIKEIKKYYPNFDNRRFVEWQAKGYLQKIRNGYYCWAETPIDEGFLFYAANQIYAPSYISLESALAYYSFIPEQVFQIRSCTTQKTNRFNSPIGSFFYPHLKKELYFGYNLVPWKERSFAIAEPEKVLLDYLYFNNWIKTPEDLISLRWNLDLITEIVDRGKLHRYAQHFRSHALEHRLQILLGVLNA